MLKLIPLILRNVLRNRRRTLLTLGSMAVSLCVLGVMVALYQGFFLREESSPSQARRVIVRHKVSLVQSLPMSYQQKIAGVEGVEAMSPWQWFGGTYKDSRDPKNMFAQFGVDPKMILKVRPDLTMSEEELKKFELQRTGAIITRRLANQFGWKVGDRIPVKSEIFNRTLEFDLAGILDNSNDEKFMLFNREYLRESLSEGSGADNARDQVGTFLVLLKSVDDVNRVCRTVDATFANSPAPTKTETEQQFSVSFVNFLGNVKLYIAVICAAITFTILLVTANTVAMAVRERTRELAILRTLGYSPGEVLLIVIGESALIGLLGGLLASGLSVLLISQLRLVGGFLEQVKPRWEQGAMVLGVSVVVGVVSAIVPAFTASRKNIVESLRFTG